MMRHSLLPAISISLMLLISASVSAGSLVLPGIFTDNMVLQREQTIPIWGTSKPKSTVSIILGRTAIGSASDSSGKWRDSLPPMNAGGPLVLTIASGPDTIVLNNVMIGDVWLCSGQSNMEMPVADWGKVANWEDEQKKADFPDIRLFTVDHSVKTFPQSAVPGSGWKPCSPQTVRTFSAAAYFFGRELYNQHKIPVGLIQATWTGSFIEAWMSGPTLKRFPRYLADIEKIELIPHADSAAQAWFDAEVTSWHKALHEKDRGLPVEGKSWYRPDLSDASWDTIGLPGYWERAGLGMDLFDGIVWFRKTIDIPASWTGKKAVLSLGAVDDWDSTFVNGVCVGSSKSYAEPRRYEIADSLVKAGRMVIAVRAVDTWSGGGFAGPADLMVLRSSTWDSLSLAGPWRYRIGFDFINNPMPQPLNFPHKATVLYNGMIHPLVPFAMKGVIWYQGESNAERAYQYRTLFPALIKSWRTEWKQGDFPFLFVQLANYDQRRDQPADDMWAELREAQRMTLSLPRTGMACAIDIGESNDIHPKNKQEVGRRLALVARVNAYGDSVECSGPVYKSMRTQGGAIRVTFTHAAGLNVHGDTLRGFSIAGSNGKFIWAQAKIDGNSVLVSSPRIKKPVAVRYGWASNPEVNLYNQEGLPAVPFRTDTWKGLTEGKDFLVR